MKFTPEDVAGFRGMTFSLSWTVTGPATYVTGCTVVVLDYGRAEARGLGFQAARARARWGAPRRVTFVNTRPGEPPCPYLGSSSAPRPAIYRP